MALLLLYGLCLGSIWRNVLEKRSCQFLGEKTHDFVRDEDERPKWRTLSAGEFFRQLITLDLRLNRLGLPPPSEVLIRLRNPVMLIKLQICCWRTEVHRLLKILSRPMNCARGGNMHDAYGVPSIALSGSTLSALDDVSVEDPDFLYIQSLAEADIVSSKMSVDDSSWQKGVRFCPDRFISRQDLISWKAKLDYEVMPGSREEISRKSLDFMDVREINSDAIVVLFKDLLAASVLDLTESDAKQPTDQTLAPIFDLNQRLVAEEEYQDNCEMARQDKLSELKLSLCRNVGHGSNRAVKRKISWQDPVALRVGLAIINIY
ncbi:hypothetical protein ACET3Z_020894 [Daucus carota]